jgi:hypothetical protein
MSLNSPLFNSTKIVFPSACAAACGGAACSAVSFPEIVAGAS